MFKIRRGQAKVGTDMAASAAFATVGLVVGGPEAAVVFAAAKPAVIATVNMIVDRGLERMAASAVEESGRPLEELLGSLEGSEDGRRLFARAVQTAAFAVQDEKLRMLGRCLAEGAEDIAKIDTELLLVTAIGGLEHQHMRLLRTAAQTHERDGEETDGWVVEEFVQGDPHLSEEVAAALLGPPIAYGIIEAQAGFGGMSYRVTNLGHLLIERAVEAGR